MIIIIYFNFIYLLKMKLTLKGILLTLCCLRMGESLETVENLNPAFGVSFLSKLQNNNLIKFLEIIIIYKELTGSGFELLFKR